MTNENYTGVTTGTVATACSLAALDAILDSSDIACVTVETPKKTLDIIIDECKRVSDVEAYAVAHKNPYNDPDVTVDLAIVSTVELLDKTDEADAFYNEQLASLEAVPELSKMLSSQDSPTVAYFYITSSGYANVRSPGDYISKMIEMAGGSYAFADASVSEDSAKATMNMQMEAFLDRALVSDILIYSTSIDGEMHSAEELYKKVPMLKQSKAASDGNIWITGKNMYQQSTAVAEMMLELHAVITGHADEDELIFLHKLK